MIDATNPPSFINNVLAEVDHTPRTVLDLNPSLGTIELAKKLPQSFVLGLILSYASCELIDEYKDRLIKENIGNISFVQGSLDSLPFEDGTFDVVLFNKKLADSLCLREINDRVLQEIYRVLSIRGQAFLNLIIKDSPNKLVNKKANDNDEKANQIIALFNKMPHGTGVRIRRKELNLEISFKRIK